MTIRVSLSEYRDASYDILIGRGLLAELPALLRRECPASAYAVISDSHVGPLYGERVVREASGVGCRVELLTFPAGEWNKTRETWAALCDRMVSLQYGRDAAVVALGGGVVGDVAGFVAATYLRGVAYVQVPTTLLAMIDSSVGGKTGVDVPAGKNMLGAFHQPRLVVTDLEVLGTLPPAQLAAGMAEALKHAVIADAEYFALLEREGAGGRGGGGTWSERDPEFLERVVTQSVAIKAQVVASDEREAGRRAVLNFGHTVGHAIETVAKFTVSHGEAVAIGMAAEARLAERLGLAERGTAERIERALQAYGLPLEVPGDATPDDLLAAMQHDKKVRAGAIRFALPARIGEMHGDARTGWTVAAPAPEVREALFSKH